MNRTTIEYVVNPDGTQGFSWNPVAGCLNNCPYCYARRIATRFAGSKAFPNGFAPTFHPDRLSGPAKLQKPATIFICTMADLFGPWLPPDWQAAVLQAAYEAPQHTYLFLTKFPECYPYALEAWGGEWQPNWWAGATVDSKPMARVNAIFPANSKIVGNHWLSVEPLRQDLAAALSLFGIDWLAIGAQTGPEAQKQRPQSEWISGIISKADTIGGIPVFLKENLRPYWQGEWRREIPWLKG